MKEQFITGVDDFEYRNPETYDQTLPQDLCIEPTRQDFALSPIAEGFDWHGILRQAEEREIIEPNQPLYLVVFRSQRRPDADCETLARLDWAAHQEAALINGYVTYFKGEADNQGNNISFCLWKSTEAALSSARKPAHIAAMRIAGAAYADFRLERYLVQHQEGDEVQIQELSQTASFTGS